VNPRCPISVLIPVKNERANIRACLESARFAAEIVVVDSGSTDGTRDMAAEFGATVADFRWDGRFPKKKNWALANIPWRHEWIFILDADERITPALADELARTVAAPDADGYYVNRRFWFLDGWLRHCGYYPSWNLRFFRHRLGRYEQFPGVAATDSGDNEVHEHVLLQGRTARLRHDMEHYAFPDIALDSTLAGKRRLKSVAMRLPFRPALRFFYHYVLRAGFLDGYRGYVFCRLMGVYEFLTVAKACELRRTNRS